MTFLLIILGVAALGTAALVIRHNLTDDTPLAANAEALELHAKSGKFSGNYRDYAVTLERTDHDGIQITVQAKRGINGELRLSGPSENAGTGTPEVKILTGNGNFDYHFWIIKSQPRDLGKQLFGEVDSISQQMINDAPFGRWYIGGNTIAYTCSSHLTDIAQMADILIALARKIDQHDG